MDSLTDALMEGREFRLSAIHRTRFFRARAQCAVLSAPHAVRSTQIKQNRPLYLE